MALDQEDPSGGEFDDLAGDLLAGSTASKGRKRKRQLASKEDPKKVSSEVSKKRKNLTSGEQREALFSMVEALNKPVQVAPLVVQTSVDSSFYNQALKIWRQEFAHVSIPVAMKIRRKWQKSPMSANEFIQATKTERCYIVEEAGKRMGIDLRLDDVAKQEPNEPVVIDLDSTTDDKNSDSAFEYSDDIGDGL